MPQSPTYHFFVSKYSQLAAYVLLVLLMIFGLWRIQVQQESIENLINERSIIRNQQALELCNEAKITRDGLRSQITSVANLGRELSAGDTQRAIAARDRFTRFEMRELEKLPIVTCPRPLPEDTAG